MFIQRLSEMKNTPPSIRNLFLIIAFVTTTSVANEQPINSTNDDIALDLDITEILKEQDINAIYKDTRVTGVNVETNEKYTNDYFSNGTVKSKRKNKVWKGIWYTDDNNQHCIRWNHKNTANCELIGLDDEGNWVKFKDDDVTKEIKSFKDIPSKSK